MLLVGLCCLFRVSNAIPPENSFPLSPFNGKKPELPEPDTTGNAEEYAFLVGGHLYGSHKNKTSPFPASTFTTHLQPISTQGGAFFVSLGDLVYYPDVNHLNGIRYLTRGMNQAFYNVPGNHDLEAPEYEKQFGTGQFAARLKQDLYLLLNTEDWMARNYKATHALLDSLIADQRPFRNLFVFSHRLAWAICEPGFESIDKRSNAPMKTAIEKSKWCALYDKVKQLQGDQPCIWFAGDIGSYWSGQLFFETIPDQKRTLVACGLGDRKGDKLLKVKVPESGAVRFEVLELTPEDNQKGSNGGIKNLMQGNAPGDQFIRTVWEKNLEPSDDKASQGMIAWVYHIVVDKRFLSGLAAGLVLALLGAAYFSRRRRNTNQSQH